MASAVQVMQSSASPTGLAPRASTAPVLEFVCLFTHDLRRKQKRWQDGRLKYHTFNKRLMVYDERGNFVGDTHWCEDYDFGEGEELQLERGSSLVQVAECVGSRDQDLSELIDKRAQEKAKRQSAALARRPPTAESATPQAVTPHFQLQQRPLHNVIGTPTGHHGRALMPTESPYEERQRQIASPQDDSTRPVKRRKRDVSPPSKSGYAQSLFGATLTLSGRPLSSAPVRHQPPRISRVREDSPAPASSDSSHHDSDPDPTPMTRATSTDVRAGPPRVHSGSSLLKVKPPRLSKPPAQVTIIDDPDPPSSPLRSETDIFRQRSSATVISHARKPEFSREAKVAPLRPHNPLQSTSINWNLRDTHGTSKPMLKTSTKHPIPDNGSISKDHVGKTGDEQRQISRPKKLDRERSHLQTEVQDSSKIVDLTAEQEPSPAEPPSVTEPRTELRIKPRKKRGLLMISERGSSGSSLPTSKITKVRENSGPLSKSFEEPFVDGLSEMGSKKEAPPTSEAQIGAHRRSRGTVKLIDDEPFDSLETHAEPKPPARKVRRKNKRGISPPDQDDETMARKQSKAIGVESYPQDEPDISSNLNRNRRSSSPLRDDSFGETESQSRQDGAQTDEDSPPRKRRSLRKKKYPVEDDIDPSTSDKLDQRRGASTAREYAVPDDAPAPRLAHLGRKNIRSKEVIGFIFDEDDEELVSRNNFVQNGSTGQGPAVYLPSDQPTIEKSPVQITTVTENIITVKTQQVEDLQAQDLVPGRDLTITMAKLDQGCNSTKARDPSAPPEEQIGAPLQRQDSATSNSLSTGTDRYATKLENPIATKPQSAPVPRLVNPATRGKKAAKPSDAAGQMPICPLPSEVGPHIPSDVGKPPNPKKKQGLDSGKKGASAPMFGFARANGGPWSREAHDLFEFRRPS
ncbi:hypothetical protein F5X99DRAFT_326003 [Biscogniauxia marginata]|nr:hypothetical protein F5X99DRAFT_326003 [Biscogniauxia marginata]